MNKKLRSIYKPIEAYLKLTEKNILTYFDHIKEVEVKNILDYFFSNNGKKIRSAIFYLTLLNINPKLKEKEANEYVDYASVLELIHSSSLIHDDIIDKSEIRRGKSSINKKFGNNKAVLTGDILYLQAFEILLNKLDKNIFSLLLDITKNMCYAEILSSSSKELSKKLYFKIIESKTARLISASSHIPAIILAEDKQMETEYMLFGNAIGHIYQLVDDIKDNDVTFSENIDLKLEIEKQKKLALKSLTSFKNNIYKEHLKDFLELLISTIS